MQNLKKLAKNLRFLASEVENELPNDELIIEDVSLSEEMKNYLPLLRKMISKESFGKIKVLIDNRRKRKPDRFWAVSIDKGEGAGSLGNLNDLIKSLKFIFRMELPTAGFIRKILDYGVNNGYVALNRVLENNQVRMRILKENV